MNKTTRTVALFAGLSLVAVGCQKEDIVKLNVAGEETQAFIDVFYTIDDESLHATFDDEQSWNAFLHRLFTLAEEGHNVSFGDKRMESFVTKEVLTYTTTSQPEAMEWADRKFKAGYKVMVNYDEKTGIYTCVAIK